MTEYESYLGKQLPTFLHAAVLFQTGMAQTTGKAESPRKDTQTQK